MNFDFEISRVDSNYQYCPKWNSWGLHCTYNTELNDLNKIICLRKISVSVERISVYKVIENLAEHGKHCLPCSTKFFIIFILHASTPMTS